MNFLGETRVNAEDEDKYSLTKLSQNIINLHSSILQNTSVNEQKEMRQQNASFNEFTSKKKLEIKDLILSKDGHNCDANEILES